jgi:sulfite exporter TauE/SafE/copper chaperone CopZ
MQRTQTLHVVGMHCASCVVLTEEALKESALVTNVKVDLAKHTATVSGELPENISETANLLSPLMPSGYSLTPEAIKPKVKWNEFIYALPIAVLFFIGFTALQKTGLIEIGAGREMGIGTALFVGLIASVSTCLAVVGGLVLSISASYAKTSKTTKPQVYFHVGRLVGFFLLGGVLGLIGKSLQLGSTGNLILTSIVAVIMLILGINLLDIFHGAGKFQLRLPKNFSEKIHGLKNSTHFAMPILLGTATFFLPCGFTQSMQAYALTTGGFLSGGLTMLVFALGTLPMLALLSFSSFSINNKPWRGVFFKTAGVVVIALAVINLLTTLAVAGIIDPVF